MFYAEEALLGKSNVRIYGITAICVALYGYGGTQTQLRGQDGSVEEAIFFLFSQEGEFTSLISTTLDQIRQNLVGCIYAKLYVYRTTILHY